MASTDSFGYWLRRRRKASDLTQRQLAELAGCTEAMIRRIEADERRPSSQLAERLAQALAVATAERADFMRAARGVGRVDLLDLAASGGPPAAQAARSAATHSLPAPPNALIGRAAEAAAIWEMLRRPGCRLISLTGPGGTGKTRLALQVAAESLDEFPDGVSFVDLTPVGDPALALPAIATSLGLRELAGTSAHERLVAFLQGRRLLLLDNFEQIIEAGPRLAELLAALPELKLLVTSRFPLRLQAEHEYPVPPLGLPSRPDEDDPAAIIQADAVQLFVARALAARPSLAMSPPRLVATAAICRALDGLPLAIELAAAWAHLFTPEALLARLDQPLALLVGGPRDAPDRQRALRATIDWSYRLLGPDEQALFRQLGVCVGGWTIEAAEALSADVVGPGRSTLLMLRALVEGHLVQAREGPDGEPRFAMLETLREYALELLRAGGELAAARRRHAEHFAALAERAEPHLHSFESRRWMDRLEAEWDNLRAALGWSQETPGGAELGLALMGASWWFWELRGRRREGREWLVALLADPATAAPTPARAKALFGAAYLLDNDFELSHGDRLLDELEQINAQLGDQRIAALILYERGSIARAALDPRVRIALLKRSLAIFEQLGDQQGSSWVHWDLGDTIGFPEGVAHFERALADARAIGDSNIIAMSLQALSNNAKHQGDIERATALLHEGLAVAQAEGDLRTLTHMTNDLGLLYLAQANFAKASAGFSASLAQAQRLGETAGINHAQCNLARIAYWQGELTASDQLLREALTSAALVRENPYTKAWLHQMRGVLAAQRGDLAGANELLQDSLACYRALDNSGGIALALTGLGHLRQQIGDLVGAKAAFHESIVRYHALGSLGVATCLIGFAALAETKSDPERAARLWGAAERMGAGSRPDQADCRPDDAPRVAEARARLAAPTLVAAWVAGAALTTAEAVAEALGED